MMKILTVTLSLLILPAAVVAQTCPHGFDKQKGVLGCEEGSIPDPNTGTCVPVTG